MSVTRKSSEGETHEQAIAALVRELREQVGDQLHDLVIERESLGSQTELVEGVQRVGQVSRQIVEARGRQQQALELGLPVTPAVNAEKELRGVLRQAVMSLGAVCGAWVVAMDFEERRPRVESGA